MLQQLAQETGAQAWVVGSLLFFVAAFATVIVRVYRTPGTVHRANAQLPLEDALEGHDDASPSSR